MIHKSIKIILLIFIFCITFSACGLFEKKSLHEEGVSCCALEPKYEVKNRIERFFRLCGENNYADASRYLKDNSQVDEECKRINKMLAESSGYEFGDFHQQGNNVNEKIAWEIFFNQKTGIRKEFVFSFAQTDGSYVLVEVQPIEGEKNGTTK